MTLADQQIRRSRSGSARVGLDSLILRASCEINCLGNNVAVPVKDSRKLIPSQTALVWPALSAIKRAGGTATNAEILNAVAADLELSEEQMAVLCGHGSRTLLDYRLAWTRTMLRSIGVITNDAPCQWSVTQAGLEATYEDIQAVVNKHFAKLADSGRKKRQESREAGG
jgi:restriction endonuclease Mrr